jgi:signal peptidase I
VTSPKGPAPTPSDDDRTAEDPEWIKDVVAKALLHATSDQPAAAPLERIPAVRAPSDWPSINTVIPEMAPLQTLQTQVIESIALGVPDTTPAVSSSAIEPNQRPEPIDIQDQPPALDEVNDHVMEETEATTEGYRSSDLRTILEWLAVIVSALVVALLIKGFVLQAFWIPSESMETTVNKGDRILVNKVSYNLHEVRRGDLVVFEKLDGTPGNTKDLIKRAIALPGETIEVRSDGRIWIWGAGQTPDDAKLLQEPYLDPQNSILGSPSASNPVSADVWNPNCANQPRTPGRCTLDDNSYFMMGDNRFRSSDSRSFGPIPDENIVGRAFLRIWPPGAISTL